ncbi:MAG: RHS repeat domain-containing protein [Fluviicola sp.]
MPIVGSYYPFGMQMPDRQNVGISGAETYRYAYNGMEQDNEVSGTGNSYTTEFRQYDPRLGRWKSIDPVFNPHLSPYNGLDNNPVLFVDRRGDDIVWGDVTGKNVPSVEERRFILNQLRQGLLYGSSQTKQMARDILFGPHKFYIALHSSEHFEIWEGEVRDEESWEIVDPGLPTGEYNFRGANQTTSAEVPRRFWEEHLYRMELLRQQQDGEVGPMSWDEMEICIQERFMYQPTYTEYNENETNGVGVDVVIDYLWDLTYQDEVVCGQMMLEDSEFNIKRRILWHELYHAWLLSLGMRITDGVESERAAVVNTNEMFDNDIDRLFYFKSDRFILIDCDGDSENNDIEMSNFNIKLPAEVRGENKGQYMQNTTPKKEKN